VVRYDPQRAKTAVQYLVDSSYTHHHLKRLRSAVRRPRALPFRDEIEVLNELLVVGRQNLQAMENLIELAESKRGNKCDYQRHFMATKRKRDRKVLLLETLMTGKELDKAAQEYVLRHQHEVWNKERVKLLQSLGDMKWDCRNAKLREFWDRKERELDALIAEAQRTGPIRRKRVVHVPRKPGSDFGKKLVKALDKH